MTLVGVGITLATVAVLVIEFFRHRRGGFALYGWFGLLILAVGEILMFRGVEPISTFFTPIAWTAYLMIADAAVLAMTGRSRLHDELGEFARTALLSIPLWLIFEAYNLRLVNWTYIGMPMSWTEAILGSCWAFATITPGIFETADLFQAFGWFGRGPLVHFSRRLETGFMIYGAACLIVPVVVPQHIGSYLFAFVWMGFVFLLDPINRRLGLPSIEADLAAGNWSWFLCLFLSGWTCGWLWEFWNYWASAQWIYIFPMAQNWKIFEMPIPGYLGFFPFAVECFTMYVTASWLIRTARKSKVRRLREEEL